MIETKTLLPGVTLRSCRDDRFKQGCLSFQLVRPMAKEESAKNVLIPSGSGVPNAAPTFAPLRRT